MKLPLKLGLPLLALLLVGLAFAEGLEYLLLLVGAMGVALWSAFSLPHPGPRKPRMTLVERSAAEAMEDAGDAEADPEALPEDGPANGSGPRNDGPPPT